MKETRLYLEGYQAGKMVCFLNVDCYSRKDLEKIIEAQEMLGRTWKFKIEEINVERGKDANTAE